MRKFLIYASKFLLILFILMIVVQTLALLEGLIIRNQKNYVTIQPINSLNLTQLQTGDKLISINGENISSAVEAFTTLLDKKGQTVDFKIERDEQIIVEQIKMPDNYPDTKLGIQFDNSNPNIKYLFIYTDKFFLWGMVKLIYFFITSFLLIKKRKIGAILALIYLAIFFSVILF